MWIVQMFKTFHLGCMNCKFGILIRAATNSECTKKKELYRCILIVENFVNKIAEKNTFFNMFMYMFTEFYLAILKKQVWLEERCTSTTPY